MLSSRDAAAPARLGPPGSPAVVGTRPWGASASMRRHLPVCVSAQPSWFNTSASFAKQCKEGEVLCPEDNTGLYISNLLSTRDVVAMILGGGPGDYDKLFPLTAKRALPAVPLGGMYRLIDLPISTCLNSHMTRIYVVTMFQSQSLNKYLHDTYFAPGGQQVIETLSVAQSPDGASWSQGTADAIRQFLWVFADKRSAHAVKDVVVLAADQIYRADLRYALVEHRKSGAAVTVLCKPCTPSEAQRVGIVQTACSSVQLPVDLPRVPDSTGALQSQGPATSTACWITGFEEKPSARRARELVLGQSEFEAFRRASYAAQEGYDKTLNCSQRGFQPDLLVAQMRAAGLLPPGFHDPREQANQEHGHTKCKVVPWDELSAEAKAVRGACTPLAHPAPPSATAPSASSSPAAGGTQGQASQTGEQAGEEGGEQACLLASTGIYIFKRQALMEMLDKYRDANDFGADLLPQALKAGYKMLAVELRAPWRDVGGSIADFWAASMDMVRCPQPDLRNGRNAYQEQLDHVREMVFCDPVAHDKSTGRLFHASTGNTPATATLGTTRIAQAYVSPGCVLYDGVKLRSTLVGSRAIIGPGTTIEDSLVMGYDRAPSHTTVAHLSDIYLGRSTPSPADPTGPSNGAQGAEGATQAAEGSRGGGTAGAPSPDQGSTAEGTAHTQHPPQQQQQQDLPPGPPKHGIGAHCVIKRAIIDKNVRVGHHVQLVNAAGVRNSGDFAALGVYIRDGIICVTKGSVIPDGTVI